jgi:hypothetical protein
MEANVIDVSSQGAFFRAWAGQRASTAFKKQREVVSPHSLPPRILLQELQAAV